MTRDQERISKAELLRGIRASRQGLEAEIARLSDTRLTAPGTDGWSVKDHMMHIVVWERSLAGLLRGEPRYAAMGLDKALYDSGDEEAANAAIHKANRQLPLAEVRERFRRSYEEVIGLIEAMSDEDLYRSYSHYQSTDPPDTEEPVIGWIIGDTSEHYDEHAMWIRTLVATG